VGQFCFIQKMPISSFGEHTPKHAKRETKVETRREGARDDRDGRRPRRDSSRRVRFVPFLARRRLSTGRVRPPSRGLLLRAHKKKKSNSKRFEMTAKSDVCTFLRVRRRQQRKRRRDPRTSRAARDSDAGGKTRRRHGC